MADEIDEITLRGPVAPHEMYEANLDIRVLDLAELMAVSAGIVDSEILEPDYFPED